MKINKSNLKSMEKKGAPVAPVSVKRKKIDEDQSSVLPKSSRPPLKRAPMAQATLSIPLPPPIIQISNKEIAIVQASEDGPTLCRSHGLAAKRDEAAITEFDYQKYANAWTENISKLMVHSLIRVSKTIPFLFFLVFE